MGLINVPFIPVPIAVETQLTLVFSHTRAEKRDVHSELILLKTGVGFLYARSACPLLY